MGSDRLASKGSGLTEKGADSDSLEARVAEEHDQLEPLFEATRVGLARSETSTALEAIAVDPAL